MARREGITIRVRLNPRGSPPGRQARYHGAQTEKMAHRPDFTAEKPFTLDQLSEIRQNFAILSTSRLQEACIEALERCWLGRDGRPPNAEQIQVLVQAWRELRKTK